MLAVESLPTHVWLVKRHLLATYRQRGIGGGLLQPVIDDAASQGKPVELRVLRVNVRAQGLYLKHGFAVVSDTPERLLMRRASTDNPSGTDLQTPSGSPDTRSTHNEAHPH